MRKTLVGILLVIMLSLLITVVSEMPQFGEEIPPKDNFLSIKYVSRSPWETGAVNVVTGIVLDYRAFDTLGEATVIFTSVVAVLAVLGRGKGMDG